MLDKKLLATNLPDPDARAASYRASNPAYGALPTPPGGVPNYGWMQGILTAKDLQLKLNEDTRAQGMLDIANHADTREERTSQIEAEAFDWKRQDHNKQQFIDDGMAQAFQQGGYSAVIDFLGNNDPERALDFTKKKLALDKSIMTNDVMRTIVPTAQAQAMVEGYNVLGKMGTALLQAPEQDRANMYAQMLPIVKTVNPDAPDSLDDNATSMFMLAAAQAMPANLLYEANQSNLSSQSALGKLDVDIRSRIAAGETMENSPQLRTMVAEYQSHGDNAELTRQKIDSMKFDEMGNNVKNAKDVAQANAAKYQLTASMNSKLQSESRRFLELQDQKATFDGAIDAISNGGGGAAQTAAYRTMAMMFNKGALSEPDVAAFANSDNMIQVAKKKLESVYSGEGIQALNPAEIQRLKILMNSVYEKVGQKQEMINNRYKTMADKFGVDQKDLSIYEPASPSLWLKPGVPADIAAQAAAAVKAGASKEAVNARIQKLMGGQ